MIGSCDINKYCVDNLLNVDGSISHHKIKRHHEFMSELRKYNKLINDTSLVRCVIYNSAVFACSSCNELLSSDIMIKNKVFVCKQCSSERRIQDMKRNLVEKYGVDNVFKLDDVKRKIVETNNIKYGCDYPQQNEIILQKTIDTNITKYGHSHYRKNTILQKRVEDKFQDMYGVRTPSELVCNVEKTKLTNLHRYGVDNVAKCDITKGKISTSNLSIYYEKYDVPVDVQMILDNKELLQTVYIDNGGFRAAMSEQLNVGIGTINSAIRRHAIDIKKTRGFSMAEKQLLDFIKENYDGEILENNRQIIAPKEIDIYLPELKLGIEYHGLYWHTFEKVKDLHFKKYLLARENGIQLLQFFSNEVKNREDVVKSIIKSNLGVNDRVFARKCHIKELSPKVYKDFCDKNHLQGNGLAKIKIGLFLEDELLSVMSFATSRYSKDCEYEMVRYCNKLNTNIIGGASKMFKYFINTYSPKSVVTYSDARISTGKLYHKLGFTYSHHANPNYFYTKDFDTLESRVKYQKHKLPDKLEVFDINKTELQNMYANGYHKIPDAGNLVFKWFAES